VRIQQLEVIFGTVRIQQLEVIFGIVRIKSSMRFEMLTVRILCRRMIRLGDYTK
jgi:hypothetical protein